ncbi:MAG: hypothetical protein ABJE95_23770 [Byssovorax sp.]
MFHQSAFTKGFVTIVALATAAAIAGCGGDKTAAGTTGAPAPSATTAPIPISTATAAAPTALTAVAPPAASASADPDEADAPIAGAKTFDCGAKGQKPCPMQKWMKTVMAGASSSGDGARLAEALTYVANHAPPGFTTWSALATDGAKKAKADDIDGAKVSCKKCHEEYKKKYKSTLRDRPF